jgi:YfiH family protein
VAVFPYPFRLRFEGAAARFSFLSDRGPIKSLADGSPAPSCAISGLAAGNQRFSPGTAGGTADDGGRPADRPGGFHGPVREAFFRSLGIAPERVYSLVQIHSRTVFSLGPGPLPEAPAFVREGDGMVSFSRLPVLAVTVADCLPVFLLDTRRGFFAVLHSGWKGTGIVLEALAVMKAAGTEPEDLAAVLGPCIQDCCYRVDEERARSFEAAFGGPGCRTVRYRTVRRDSSGVFLSLQGANIRLLAAAGVRHIARCEDCTFTGENLGSFRRQGPSSYTLMAALAGF